MKAIAFLIVALFLAGCQCPRTDVVSLATIINGAHRVEARLIQNNVIQPDMAMKLQERYLNFLRADFVAREALKNCLTGGPDSYTQAFAIAAQSAHEYVGWLIPFLSPMDSIALQTRLKAANCP